MHSTYSPPQARPVTYKTKAPLSMPLRVDITRSTFPGFSRELPMPHVTRIYNLSQAQATLLHCANKLSASSSSSSSSASSSPVSSRGSASPVSDERPEYHQWLERWELAFTDFLAGAMPTMSTEDLTQCRVLKANHLACTVQAADAGNFDVFEAEFQAIVELAGAVLRCRQAESPGNSPIRSLSPSSKGLDVRDPLYIVAMRCAQRNVRQRANDLLTRYYRN